MVSHFQHDIQLRLQLQHYLQKHKLPSLLPSAIQLSQALKHLSTLSDTHQNSGHLAHTLTLLENSLQRQTAVLEASGEDSNQTKQVKDIALR